METYVGQVLDDKYHLERLLGRGGMGAVYLATHLGTERYVALKLIAPQFMRNSEFVERFKREARAAGRLRHPNVVDVTDFGFARAGDQSVAYLVMEYLDGCTLSDVLAEEQRLPVYWVADILEQVCSAVHEAHQQGIVHRDLKPDNIWLEPNRLGGYRVKVLDFGIAKVATNEPEPDEIEGLRQAEAVIGTSSEAPTLALSAALGQQDADVVPTQIAGASTVESETMILPEKKPAEGARPTQAIEEIDATRLYDAGHLRTTGLAAKRTDPISTAATDGLTRVGAILGTPLYMSPEQCRGEVLDARSDIYSLGIIAYQMLAGAPPFAGDSSTVLRAHNESKPTPLRDHNRKLHKRVARVIMSALEKDPAARPQTAVAFASSMRANVDGLGALYRRAFALYSEYFPKFLKLSLLAHIPVFIVLALSVTLRIMESRISRTAVVLFAIPIGVMQIAAEFLCGSIISGVTAIIVTQLAAAPLKPVEMRPAFDMMRKRWKPFLNTGIRVLLRIILGFCLLVIPGFVMMVRYMLWGPVVLMEGLEKKAAIQRARALAARSWRTVIAAFIIQIMVPAIIGGIFGGLIGATTHGKPTMRVKVASQFSVIINIFVVPLISIVSALIYLKMRQFGGETLTDAMAQIEELQAVRTAWQQRMRTRLTMHTPHHRTHPSGATSGSRTNSRPSAG